MGFVWGVCSMKGRGEFSYLSTIALWESSQAPCLVVMKGYV